MDRQAPKKLRRNANWWHLFALAKNSSGGIGSSSRCQRDLVAEKWIACRRDTAGGKLRQSSRSRAGRKIATYPEFRSHVRWRVPQGRAWTTAPTPGFVILGLV